MTSAKILVVEDECIVAKDLQNRLNKFGYVVLTIASSGEEAINKAAETCPDLVLMDINLKGDMDGVEAAKQIHTRFNIPVIYLTAYADDNTLERAKVTEASGYLLKPFKERELYTNIEIALSKHRIEQERLVASSELRSALERESRLSRTDPATGVANRRLFVEFAKLEIETAHKYKHPLTVVYIDIDNFKIINDTCGHHTGDRVLQTVAETIKDSLRETDVVARLGGDEFAILLPKSEYEPAQIVIRRVQKRLLESMERQKLSTTFSIGAVTFTQPPSSVDEMLKQADSLMYLVKNNGKNQIEHRSAA